MGAGSGAGAGHVLQHGAGNEGVAGADDAVFFRQLGRRRFDESAAIAVGDAGDEVGLHEMPAIGKDGKSGGHLQRGDGAGAERHGQIGRLLVGVKAKARDPLLPHLRGDGLQDADGDHVLGAHQRAAHGHRAFKGAVVVFGLPGLAAGDAGVEIQRGVIDDSGRRHARFQPGGVDEGLEAGAGLAPGLRGVVELVFGEVEAAHHGLDGAGARIKRHQRAFHFRLLRDVPFLAHLHDADDGARTDAHGGPRLGRKARLR